MHPHARLIGELDRAVEHGAQRDRAIAGAVGSREEGQGAQVVAREQLALALLDERVDQRGAGDVGAVLRRAVEQREGDHAGEQDRCGRGCERAAEAAAAGGVAHAGVAERLVDVGEDARPAGAPAQVVVERV
ncbi:MAG TPA: hypothetical protein VGD80_37445, partial [Kofleriaceae bacterium]